MLYKIKFISDEVSGFLRELRIDSDATFLDLNRIILEACQYPDDQMTSFYICDEEWERGQQITREDMSDNGHVDEDLYCMAETALSDFIEDEGQRLEFVFDPFSDRVFYLEVKEIIPGEHLPAPEVIRAAGNPPQQIQQLDFSAPPRRQWAGRAPCRPTTLMSRTSLATKTSTARISIPTGSRYATAIPTDCT